MVERSLSFDQNNVMSMDEFIHSLEALYGRTTSLKKPFRRIANSFWQINRTSILASTNQRWFEPLSEVTKRDKEKRGFSEYPILTRTGQFREAGSIRESLITGSDSESVYVATDTDLELGTSNEKAYFNMLGVKTASGRLVRRNSVEIERYPLARWTRWVGDYVLSGKDI